MTEKNCKISYRWLSFAQLTAPELYQLLQLRQQVFVVEQHCAYLDADGLDAYAWHLLAWQNGAGPADLVAYLRVIFPGKKYREPALGRVVTAPAVRGRGIGRELIQKALNNTAEHYPGQPITISAQFYLKDFYEDLGFVTCSKPYDEDGIIHIDMTHRN